MIAHLNTGATYAANLHQPHSKLAKNFYVLHCLERKNS
jgi:hypothetical protein